MGYRSADELREILDAVLREIDADPEDGPRLRGVAGPLRLEFTDLRLVLNLVAADQGRHCVHWNFSRRSSPKPRIKFAMNSDFANRFLQGRENPAIAIARGSLRTTVGDASAALSFFPAARPLFSHYREIISRKYPHLALD